MIFIAGTKIVNQDRGWAADLCPVCRIPKPMKIREVQACKHLYWVPVGGGKPVRHEAQCGECGIFVVRRTDHYSQISQTELPIEQLVEQTNPGLHEALDAIREQESDALRAPRGGELRLALMATSVTELYPWAQSLAIKGASESVSAVLALLFIVNAITVVFLFYFGNSLAIPMLGPGVVLLIVVVRRAMVSTKRATGQAMIPKLAGALASLDPSEEEIRTVWESWLDEEVRASVAIPPRALRNAIEQFSQPG